MKLDFKKSQNLVKLLSLLVDLDVLDLETFSNSLENIESILSDDSSIILLSTLF